MQKWYFLSVHTMQVPLLEMVGARSLARALCTAPRGSKDPARFVRDAKAVATHQGAASALLNLLQLVVGRYMTLRSEGKLLSNPFPLLGYLEDDPACFTRDMANMEGVLETLYYTCAALLNLSTLRVAQLVLARRGLASLLGAQSLFSSHMSDAGAQEQRISELLVGVVQNLAQHPQNRTCFYKAELSGTVALQRELLERGETSYMQSESPLREQPLPPMPPPRVGANAWRPSTHVKSGFTELHGSLDSTLSAQVRPKAMFPAISRQAAFGTQRTGPPGEGSSIAPHATHIADGRADEEDAAAVRAEEPSVAALFTAWMDSTFQGSGEEEAVAAAPTKHLRMVHPDTGAWQNERDGFPLLLRALRRPIAAMWADSVAARRMCGAKRWNPSISEYRQADKSVSGPPMHAMAARLMHTNAPSMADAPLDDAACQLAAHGAVEDSLLLVRLRPSTAERRSGRVPLTVLKPDLAPDSSVMPLPDPCLPVRFSCCVA
jgi:hypothetical protein